MLPLTQLGVVFSQSIFIKKHRSEIIRCGILRGYVIRGYLSVNFFQALLKKHGFRSRFFCFYLFLFLWFSVKHTRNSPHSRCNRSRNPFCPVFFSECAIRS